MITQEYKLNLIPDKVPVIVNCSQYDVLSRTILFSIYNGMYLYAIPSGVSATVRGTKADNTGFEYTCTIDGSKVSFDIQAQMTLFAGKVPCEIRLIDSSGIVGTCNFLLNVEETPLDPDITISESDLPLLERAEQNAIRSEEAADRSEDEADRAEAEAGHIVEISKIKAAYVEKVGHSIGNGQIYCVLKRHGWRKVMPRSQHPQKASDEAIEASKKLSIRQGFWLPV